MATFNIQAGSVKLIDGEKTSMIVTFKTADARVKTCYHETEAIKKEEIEKELQRAANEFEVNAPVQVNLPSMTTGQDLSVDIGE